jgi:hypothetical protein
MVRRFALAIVVALLTFSASGVSAVVVPEPCTGYEQPGQDDGACPPTCVTCGCCAQAVEPAVLSVTISFDAPPAETAAFVPSLPRTHARDILHVPKLRFE